MIKTRNTGNSLWQRILGGPGAGALHREILRLAIPSIIAGITIPLVGIADTAIAGRLGTATAIGGIAIGTMLFDWLYWNMGFLRMGTAGFTAQAYGRGDHGAVVKNLLQGCFLALVIAVLVIALQKPYAKLFFWIVPTSDTVAQIAKEYFFIRIWAAPATLSLFAIRGWFIGLQNTLCPMVIDFVVNVANIGLAFFLALGLDWGVSGIAWGIVLAQYLGLLTGLVLIFMYGRSYFKYIDLKAVFCWDDLRKLLRVNANLFFRSVCMLLVYSGFTALASPYGDTLLAIASIMMKLLLLYSYVLDGFAYAGEALTGRFVGAREGGQLRLTIRSLFLWGAGIGIASTFMYIFADEWLLRLMTSSAQVIAQSQPFLPWLYIMPFISCVAFTWDGIYIGATASKAIRNSMVVAVAAFYVCYVLLRPWLGIQALWAAYTAHLVARSVMLTVMAKKNIYQLVP